MNIAPLWKNTNREHGNLDLSQLSADELFVESARLDDVGSMEVAVQRSAEPFATINKGENVYMVAGEAGSVGAIHYAAELKVPVNLVGKERRTGLYNAFEARKPEAALTLLGYGALPLADLIPENEQDKKQKRLKNCFVPLGEALKADDALSYFRVGHKTVRGIKEKIPVHQINDEWSPVVAQLWDNIFKSENFKNEDALQKFWNDKFPDWMKQIETQGRKIASVYMLTCMADIRAEMNPEMFTIRERHSSKIDLDADL